MPALPCELGCGPIVTLSPQSGHRMDSTDGMTALRLVLFMLDVNILSVLCVCCHIYFPYIHIIYITAKKAVHYNFFCLCLLWSCVRVCVMCVFVLFCVLLVCVCVCVCDDINICSSSIV